MWTFQPDFVLLIFLTSQDVFHPTSHRKEVSASFIIPGMPEKRFVKVRDINIGVLVPMSRYSRGQACSSQMSLQSVHYTQIMEYIANGINQRNELPGNVTLGFAILDDCFKENVAVAQSLTFVPQTTCQGQETTDRVNSDVIDPYDVVAVIGSSLSSQSVAVAHVLGPALVPLISFFSTSDDLSNKAQFPYFLRTTAPDRFQFQAMFSIILQYSWNYVSIIYMEGSYGENGFKQLRDLFDTHGICLAAVHKVPTRMTDTEALKVAESLVEYKAARAVVIITPFTNAYKMISATRQLVPTGTFTWIGSDGWAGFLSLFEDLGDALLDTFHVSHLKALVPEYDQHFKQLRPADTSDPWFPEFWESFFQCSLDNKTCDTNMTIGRSGQPYTENRYSGHMFDTVSMIANAVSRVLRSLECSGLVGTAARRCVTGPRLLKELKATRQNGYTGWLELDSNGDRLGRYVIRQVVWDAGSSGNASLAYKTVAEFDSLSGQMVKVRNVSWAHHTPRTGVPHPESRCSYPCGAHEARVVQEVTCCWLCQPCRVNERLILNGSRCDPCPLFTWPDSTTANTTCLTIPPASLRVDTVMGGVQVVLGLLCLVACLVVFVFFHRHRNCRVIKASSRELSFMMLLAIATGYVVMVTLVAPPTDFTCRLNFLFFCVSFTLIYGPLLVRAVRIFRIFEGSKRSARRPRMIASSHQILFSFGFLSIQVLMCCVEMAVYPSWHKLTQSSLQERYVELTCDLPLAGLTSFLTYNLLLMAVCTLLAFKTRRLPDNFNESRFISMCVSTTLVILICFIPAYLVSGSELLRMLMLGLAVALNHSVALVFLFLPKIYAVLYLEGAAEPDATVARETIETRSTFMASRNQVAHTTGDSPQSGEHGKLNIAAGTATSGYSTGRSGEIVLQVRPATHSTSDL